MIRNAMFNEKTLQDRDRSESARRLSLRPTLAGKLNLLVNLNRDSVKAFRKMADMIDDPIIVSTFRRIVRQREGHTLELTRRMKRRGSRPIDDGGTAVGVLHRSWLDARQSLGTGELAPLLAEARRGEKNLQDSYDDALAEAGDHPIRTLLAAQRQNVGWSRRQIERFLLDLGLPLPQRGSPLPAE